jgi:hypothetical protein
LGQRRGVKDVRTQDFRFVAKLAAGIGRLQRHKGCLFQVLRKNTSNKPGA